MYKKILFLSLLVGGIFLGCGNSTEPVISQDIGQQQDPTSNTPSKKPAKTMVGYVVDSPIWGLEYRCKGQKTKFTDKNGKFECEKMPATFKVGNLIVGHVGVMPKDKKVYPQDIVGVSRSEIDDKDVVKLTRFLQTLDDDGDIDEVIKIDPKIANEFKNEKPVEVALLDTKSISALVQKNIGREIVTKEEATKHLRKNVVDGKKPTAIEVILPDEIADGLSGEAVVNGIYDIDNGTIKSQITDKITFTSSNPSVAKIDKNGKILALKEGYTEIEAKFGELKATLTLKISHPTLTNIKIKKPTIAELTAMSYGHGAQFHADGFYSVDNLVKDVTRQVVWNSKSPLFSSLYMDEGYVPNTGENIEGNASILATLFDITDKVEFEIKKSEIKKIALDITPTIPKGRTVSKSILGFYQDDSNTTYDYEADESIAYVANWSSSNEGILDLSSQSIKAKEKGEATLSVEYKGFEDNITITVTDPVVKYLSFDVNKYDLEVNETAHATVFGRFTDDTRKDITDKVILKSLNPAILKISADGNITALKAGYGSVQAIFEANDRNITDMYRLFVKPQPIGIDIKLSGSKDDALDEIPLGFSKELMIDIAYEEIEESYGSGSVGFTSYSSSYYNNDNVQWKIVSGDDVATLDTRYGATLRAIKKGEVTVKATWNNLTAEKTFTVTDPLIENISLGVDKSNLEVNETAHATVFGHFTDDTRKDITDKVILKSLNPAILKVSADGNITALKAGYGSVQAILQTDDRNITSMYRIFVNPQPIAIDIKLSGSKDDASDEIPLGSYRELMIDITYEEIEESYSSSVSHSSYSSSYYNNDDVQWEIVSGDDVATLDTSYGATLRAIKKGEVTVKATWNNFTAEKTFTVTDPVVTSYYIEPYYDRIFVGKSKQFKLVARYTDNTQKDINESVTWSLNSNIATVTDDGNVTGVSEGGVRLTATYKGESVSKTLTIKKLKLYKLDIRPHDDIWERLDVNQTKQQQLSVSGYYNDDTEKEIKDYLTWSSNDPDIATVDENGLVTLKSIGHTEITVKYENDGISLQTNAIVEVMGN